MQFTQISCSSWFNKTNSLFVKREGRYNFLRGLIWGAQFFKMRKMWGGRNIKTQDWPSCKVVTTYHPDLKKTLMANWSLMENQPLLKTIFKDLRSYATKELNLWKTRLLEQKCTSKAFDNATQPQKPLWEPVQVYLWLPFKSQVSRASQVSKASQASKASQVSKAPQASKAFSSKQSISSK